MSRFFNFRSAVHTVLAVGFCYLMALPLASADDHSNWYVSGGVGYALETTMDFSVTNSPYPNRAGYIEVTEENRSYNVAIGREMGPVRLQVEALWVEYGPDEVIYSSLAGVPDDLLPVINETATIDGIVKFKIFMVGVVKDLRTDKKWVPYVGVGAGLAEAELDVTLEVYGVHGSSVGQADEVPVYQLAAGVKYELSDNTSMYLDARNLWVDSVDFQQAGGSVLNGGDSSFTELPMVGVGFTRTFGKRDKGPRQQPPYRRYRP